MIFKFTYVLIDYMPTCTPLLESQDKDVKIKPYLILKLRIVNQLWRNVSC